MNENKPITVLLAAPSYDGRFDVRFMDSLINTMPLCEQNNIKVGDKILSIKRVN